MDLESLLTAELTASAESLEIQTQKGSNKRSFILTRTRSVHTFREIRFIKPQNDT